MFLIIIINFNVYFNIFYIIFFFYIYFKLNWLGLIFFSFSFSLLFQIRLKTSDLKCVKFILNIYIYTIFSWFCAFTFLNV